MLLNPVTAEMPAKLDEVMCAAGCDFFFILADTWGVTDASNRAASSGQFFKYMDSMELDYAQPDGNSKYGLFDTLSELESAATQRFAHLVHQELKPNPLIGRVGTVESSSGESIESSGRLGDDGVVDGPRARLLKKKAD